eukprot:gene3068-3532_t
MAATIDEQDRPSLQQQTIESREECTTPVSVISATSSSSEDEAALLPLDSYHVIKRTLIDKPRQKQAIQIPKIDPTAIIEIEEQAKLAANSLAEMTDFLSKQLYEMSKISSQTIGLYGEAVDRTASSVESNIHVMYGLMAKCEELNRKMKPVYDIQAQIQTISQQLNEPEAACDL